VPAEPSPKDKAELEQFIRTKLAPLNSVAVMPDGSVLTRKDILIKLGLSPDIPIEAWLNVLSCGNNSAAVRAAAGMKTR